jgi:hypothetical protein
MRYFSPDFCYLSTPIWATDSQLKNFELGSEMAKSENLKGLIPRGTSAQLDPGVTDPTTTLTQIFQSLPRYCPARIIWGSKTEPDDLY